MNFKSTLAIAAALCVGTSMALAQSAAPAKAAAKPAAAKPAPKKAAPAAAEPAQASPEQLAAADEFFRGHGAANERLRYLDDAQEMKAA